ncbi:right-handed parallel beta-helix repeat-containing protein [Agriterribacter sp.]|uniref:right-handed parallel beta-helix repeat-containing protein n=1 Tax=Agriterribacter sp. TaxID=2821509 RepID=UPI002C7726F0|nr:right-handed parallel beta-helix repeat-containing protein [Agriterribacter sp.]HRP57891.1 right-handed parallel beta-helix repeat-containing protein [Agriterribacter sp.]
MKQNFWFTLFLPFSFLLFQDAVAQNIYIAPGGNDSNPGTAEQPLATLTAARDRICLLRKQDPDAQHAWQVIIRKGEYIMPETLTLTVEDGGTEISPLVFKGEEGAVFYGGFYLNRFEKVSDSLWKTDVPEVRRYGWRFEQLFVNGTRVTRAQTPNKGFYSPVSVKETVIVKGDGRAPELAVQQIKIPAEAASQVKNLSEEDWKDAVITFYHHWDNTKKHVQFYNAADTSIYISGQGMKPWNPITTKSLFAIENLQPALDAPGEWFIERFGTLYYRPRPGETIETTIAMAPLLDKFIAISGNEKTGEKASNIRFENIAFRVAGYRMPPSGVEPAQAAAPIAASIEMDFASRVSFVNCEISGTGGSGIWFRRACDNGLIEHCYLHDLGAGAVKIGETVLRANPGEVTHHIKVVNNIARSGGHVFPCAVGMIIFHGSDNELLHNEISDFKYSGVSVGWVWGYTPSPSKRNRVEYNHIHHLGWGVLSDMGGVYTLGASQGTTVSNNVIHHIYSLDYGGWGLYTDEGSEGITMENNLVYNCKSSGFHQHYGKENIIRNNIFVNSIKAQLQATRVEKHLSFSFTNNIVYFNSGTLLSSNWPTVNIKTDENCYRDTRSNDILFGRKTFAAWQQEGKDKHSVIADPGFKDVKNFDFRITNKRIINKIKFKPFDHSKAGVYGTDDWIQKAKLDAARAGAFDQMVAEHEARAAE